MHLICAADTEHFFFHLGFLHTRSPYAIRVAYLEPLEPWSSGYGRWLVFERLWLRIQRCILDELDIFHIDLVWKNIVCLKGPK